LDDLNNNDNYTPSSGYKRSKLCNVLFTNQLSTCLSLEKVNNDDSMGGNQEISVSVFSVSPGIVYTKLGRYIHLTTRWPLLTKLIMYLLTPLYWLLTNSAKEGASTSIYCATQEQLEDQSGSLFRKSQRIDITHKGKSMSDSKRLWDESEKLVQKWLK
jgi:retinol dehydrogenase 12